VAKAQNQSRLAFGLAVTDMAGEDERVVAISADTLDLLGLRDMLAAMPARVIEAGIAEQNAMGMASGLATTGMRPYLCGYAPFITARSMEQLRNDVAYANQRVVIGAACSGITLAVSGGTHHALEDIALMRSLPNMTIVVPADALEAWHLTHATQLIDGACYVRLGGRYEETPITALDATPQIGRADILRAGKDLAVIACGCLVAEALVAAEELAGEGIDVRVINMHTIKPLDRDAVLEAAYETHGIVTAEEHHLTGGLGGAVAELLAEENPTRMRFVGMPDEFSIVGPTRAVREHYGMSAAGIVASCRELMVASG
jgi:transketolase